MKSISNYKTFISVFAILIFSNLLHRILGYNELTLLVIAKSFYNPNWIAQDFALSTHSDYQLLYNYFAGFLAQFLPLTTIAVIGRFFTYFIFSIGLHYFNKILKLPWYLFALAFFLFLGNQSVIAGEWMVKGFEFKSLAYAAIFIALYYWVERKKWISFIFLGLAVSFHVLIGCYAFIALMMATALSKDFNRDTLKYLPLFFLFGIVGWFSIFQFVFQGSSGDFTQDLIKYYVQLRVRHHVYPAAWTNSSLILFTVFNAVSLLCYFYIVSSRKVKFIYLFAFSHLLFFLIGMILYSIGDYAKLKYYWFRTADIYSSFLFFVSLFLLLQHLITKLINYDMRLGSYANIIARLGLVVLLLVLIRGFTEDYTLIKNSKNLDFVDNRFPFLNEAYYWINEHTSPTDGVISSPYNDFYFVMAERRAFVNFKTGPADLALLGEWYKRLKILNNEQEFDLDKPFYSQWELFENNFHQINEVRWLEIAKEYNFQYLLCKAWVEKDFDIVYQNEAFILYKIE